MKKMIRRLMAGFMLLLIFFGLFSLWNYLPVISGHSAMTLCSGLFVSHRSAKEIEESELDGFPFGLASCHVDWQDSAVICSVWGMATQKAVCSRSSGAMLQHGPGVPPRTAPSCTQRTVPPADDPLDRHCSDGPFDEKRLNAVLDGQLDSLGYSRQGTRALLIAYKDKIVTERYAAGFADSTMLAGWSMTKAMLNALVGVLVMKGKLDTNQSNLFFQWRNDDRKKIRLADLMHMTSGLRWKKYSPSGGDATRMLFREPDMMAYAADVPLSKSPGSTFNYGDGSAMILSGLIQRAVPNRSSCQLIFDELFSKMGMWHSVVETDEVGTLVGCCYGYASARDWLRLGMLYLHDGMWNEQRILPEGWVKWTTTPVHALSSPVRGGYGALFWLNQGKVAGRSGRLYPDLPADCFFCQGFAGQYMWIVPSLDLIVLRLGFDQREVFDANAMMNAIVSTLVAKRRI
jgi:CubicO group peptidase (beta-lactamase class C family)